VRGWCGCGYGCAGEGAAWAAGRGVGLPGGCWGAAGNRPGPRHAPRDRANPYSREHPKGRDPGSPRIAHHCGISRVAGGLTSRKRSLCGPTRDKGARERAHCMICAASGEAWGCRGLPATCQAPDMHPETGRIPTVESTRKVEIPEAPRIAHHCGISRVAGGLTSRKRSLCGPTRDKGARERAHCMICAASGEAWGCRGLPATGQAPDMHPEAGRIPTVESTRKVEIPEAPA
jgi:hypothetical protein